MPSGIMHYPQYSATDVQKTAAVQTSGFTPTEFYPVWPCSGTFTVSLPDVTTFALVRTWSFPNLGTGTITLDPAGSQTINGRSTWRLERDSSLTIQSTAAGWTVLTGHNHNRGSVLPTDGLYAGLAYQYLVGGQVVNVTYDGTRWLGPEFPLGPTYGIQSTLATTWNANAVTLYFKPTNDYAAYLTRLEISYVVQGTHDASNYYKILVWRYRRGAGWQQIDDNTWTTDKTTANDDINFIKTAADFANNPLHVDQNYVRIDLEKVGSPAAIGFSGVGFSARRIYP